MPDDAAAAGNAPPGAPQPRSPGPSHLATNPFRSAARTGFHLVVLVFAALLYLAVASLLALLIVRVGADLIDGIDPFVAQDRRPRLFPRQLAQRELAVDIARQAFLAILVLGTAVWRDGAAWRRSLALERSGGPGLAVNRLLLILLLWPLVHIVWVTGTAEVFRTPFAHNVALSSALGLASVAAWLAYVVVLAPAAEELLMRGEMFGRARRFLGPAAAILVTALVFCAAHVSQAGFARPVSLLPLALTLGWLRWRTGRLWPCIALHGWSNLAILVYVLWPGSD